VQRIFRELLKQVASKDLTTRKSARAQLRKKWWIFHDLRRADATGMASFGIPPHVVDKILNHRTGAIRGVTRIYNRFEYGPERRKALEAWANHVTALVDPAARQNVTQLRLAAA